MNSPTPELYAAVSAAQATIGHAAKDSQNPHFRSRYASLPAVLDAIRQPFADHGLALIQCPSLEGTTLKVETIIAHKGGGTISCVLACSLPDAKPQTVGSAISYLRRYGAMALAGVAAADEDDDGEAVHGRAAAKPQTQPPKVASVTGEPKTAIPKWSEDQLTEAGRLRAEIMGLGGETGDKEVSEIRKRMKYDAPSDMIDALAECLRRWQDIAAHDGQVVK